MGMECIVIVTITAFVVQVVKQTKIDNKWMPIIAGTIGGILGAAMYYIGVGDLGDYLLEAVAVGISSGLAATGAHQMYKQIKGGLENGN